MTDKIVFHVGMGKCGTSALQTFVFPLLGKISSVSYNDHVIMDLLCRVKAHGIESSVVESMRQRIAEIDKPILISDEGFLDWNPHFWEASALECKELFGDEVEILITIRGTKSYLRSVYQQVIHEGNVKRPEKFFLNGSRYDAISTHLIQRKLDFFDVDSFSFERLKAIFKGYFSSVHFLAPKHVKDLGFLRRFFELDDERYRQLVLALSNAPYVNRSYSSLSMKLTFFRERVFNLMGATTIGSGNIEMLINKCDKHKKYIESNMSNENSIIPKKIKTLAYCLTHWRPFNQLIVGRFFYVKYELPENIYFNKELDRENSLFLSKLEQEHSL